MNKSINLFLSVSAVLGAVLFSAYWFGGLAQSAVESRDLETTGLVQKFALIYQPMAAGVLAFGLYGVGALAVVRNLRKLDGRILLSAGLCLGAALVISLIWETSKVFF